MNDDFTAQDFDTASVLNPDGAPSLDWGSIGGFLTDLAKTGVGVYDARSRSKLDAKLVSQRLETEERMQARALFAQQQQSLDLGGIIMPVIFVAVGVLAFTMIYAGMRKR